MKSLTTYITVSVLFLFFSLNNQWSIPSIDLLPAEKNVILPCPITCQTVDSLALIAIYNSTMGPGWTNLWDTSTPVCTPWDGVELDNEGYVVRLTLNNNNLIGPLPPEIGDFSRVEELQLDNNSLSGNIPTQIGNLSQVEICFLDDNNFTGTIPEEMGNLSMMHTLYLDNNQLVGAIPNTFLNLNNLFKFDIFNNFLDSIPDLSSMNLQANKFRIYNNEFTFDDIVLNDLTALGVHYTPQDSVNQAETLNLQTGIDYTLDLDFDNGITDNIYQWYKDGVIHGGPTNSNKLIFAPVTFATAGEYRCRVINPNASLLTLHTRPVTINVICGTSTLNITDTLCHDGTLEFNSETYDASNPTDFLVLPGQDQYGCDSIIIVNLSFRPENVFEISETICIGDSIVVNNTVYNQGNPDGTETLIGADQFGCDSVITINLNFRPENIFELSETICIGDSIVVNNTVYNHSNPDGTETLISADQFGCDSIVEVDLSFYTAAAAGNLSPIICPGDSIELFGTFYTQDQPTGTVVLNNATATSCDSTIFIEVQFYPQALGTYSPTICEGGSVMIGGETFNEAIPSGQVNLGPISVNSCDSFVNVNLSFSGPEEGTYEDILCYGDSVVINNTVYNQTNPSGTELYPNGAANSCDSVVFVNLTFDSNITEFLNPTICRTDSIIVNGTIYNEDNLSGNEMISGGSSNGCDSTVVINLSFYPDAEGSFETTLCSGDSIIINGVTYNESNPSGSAFFAGGSLTGCDSTLLIDLSFHPAAIRIIEETLCPGDSMIINSITYNESNPSGTELISGGSSTGCDSTILVNLSFFNQINILVNPIFCSGDSIIVNNVTYNFGNPAGTETITSETGCDSTINIDLSFYPSDPTFIIDTLCSEQGISVNNTPYNEFNPSGTEIISGGSVNGCDSTIIVDLTFVAISEGLLDPTLCPGDSVVINGVVYNESNPTGIQYFENEAASGCDSSVVIDLSYYIDIPGSYTETLCPGDSVLINGVVYNENNLSGTEILQGASINGCDSTLVVNLDYYPEVSILIDDILCEQDQLIINNEIYNISNPSGTEVIVNGSINGCDSTIIIDLSFNTEVTTNFNQTLCPGDSIIVNNIVYNETNPTGMETFIAGSANGCDSIININLSFHSEVFEMVNEVLCVGDSLISNGTVYNLLNPNGTEFIENGTQNGCDSFININLSFFPPATGTLQPIVCDGDMFEYNGQFFDTANPSGNVLLEGASVNGCDSTVAIQLSFYDPVESDFNTTICDGDSLFFNGTVFHAANPTGQVTLENASVNGCDSTISVQVNFHDPIESDFTATICEGDSLLIDGTVFNIANPTGIVTLENASINGCDSIVSVQVNFFDQANGSFTPTICQSDSILFQGVSYHINNPTGTAILENASTNGCDSIVAIQVNFFDQANGSFTPSICQGDSLLFQGVSYHANNPTGTAILENASTNGCDSIVSVQLNFYDPVIFEMTASICEGSSFEIEGQSFSENGTFEILLENASAMGCDSTIQLQVEVLDANSFGIADAGGDIAQCETNLSLIGNLPNGSTGLWESMEGNIIENPEQATIDINNLNPGLHHFIWTLSAGQCLNYDSDTVQVYIQESPNAVDDQFTLDIETSSLELDLLQNDILTNNQAWTFDLLDAPNIGTLDEVEEGIFQFNRNSPIGGDLVLQYELCDEDCPSLCDTAFVNISLVLQSIEDLDIPNAITPNGDGVNETFMFPHLEFEPDKYPDKELIIFNRWGNIVYEAQPYLNDWNGVDKGGNALPQGTYYYVLRLDIATGIILKGDVSILK